MALCFEATIKRWNMSSSDAMPTDDVPEGSTIHIVDTGELYVYHNGMWAQDLRLIYAIVQAQTWLA